ncbi:MAG: FUSC family protein [Verrucomicrobia bacterium]|nr:FUSC family protein [Verrucomicrobiota bacterium]
MAAQTVSAPAKKERLFSAFDDLRVRNGIKFGFAGTLALYWTQVLRLPHANWAILTVLVMMSAQFVGSAAIKAFLRSVGTISGAAIGVWLVGDYASTPAVLLPVLFIVIAFSSYKFGQYPASQVPYAYFLLGMTTLVVVTYGVTEPADAWQIGLDRTLEILVGVAASLLVNVILWPRYAREEFVETGRAALGVIRTLVLMHLDAFVTGGPAPPAVESIRSDFRSQLAALKNLLTAGARESTVFASRLSHYNEWLVSLVNLFHAALDLDRGRSENTVLVQVRTELRMVADAVSEEFDILTAPRSPGEKLRKGNLNEAFARLEEKINELRNEDFFFQIPMTAIRPFYAGVGALRSIRDELNNLHNYAEGLPRIRQPLSQPKPHWDPFPSIDWFWFKIGIKGGLVAVISIVLLKWINPPGAAGIPLIAFVITISGKTFLLAKGTGDMRAHQNFFLAALFFAALACFLMLATPFLATYLVMNVALFFILFAFGFFTARVAGMTFPRNIVLLSISSFVGLNPQTVVPAQTIIDTFSGMLFGLSIASIAGRLLWPTLPQGVVRGDILKMLGQMKALVRGDPNREKIETQLTLLTIETIQITGQMRNPGFRREDLKRLDAFIRELQIAASRLGVVVSRSGQLPEPTAPILRPELESIEVEICQLLDGFIECFHENDSSREFPRLHGALDKLDQALEVIRQNRILQHEALEAPVRLLELVDRYHAVVESLSRCSELVPTLADRRFWGDYAL